MSQEGQPDHSGPDQRHLDQWYYHHTPLELAAHLAQRHDIAIPRHDTHDKTRISRHDLADWHVLAHQTRRAPLLRLMHKEGGQP